MSKQGHNIKSLVKAKFLRAILGGLAGTIVFGLMATFLAPKVLGYPMDPPALLAPALGGSYPAAVIIALITGVVVIPFLYLVIALGNFPIPVLLRGPVFLICIYLFTMTILLPLAGAGLFFGEAPKAMVALVAHVVSGFVMGAIIGKPDTDQA
jgi:hypothetical protein